MKLDWKIRRSLSFRSTTELIARRRRLRRRIAAVFALSVSVGLLLAELA